MKKSIFLSALFAVLSIYSLEAQTHTYQVGDNTISAGIGLGSSIGGFTYGSQSPGISVQYERGIWKAGPGVISLGGYLGYKSYKYGFNDGYGDGYNYKWDYTIIGARGAWHFTELNVPNFDLYGGLMLSYNHLSFSDTYSSRTGRVENSIAGSYGSDLGFSAFVGGRYFFANNLGAFFELGYGVSYVNLGLTYKF